MKFKKPSFRFWGKQNPVGGIIPISPGNPKSTPRNYTQLSKEGYIKNNVCFSAVKMVAMNCAQVKFAVQTKDGNPIPNHPVLGLLENPNPSMGKSEFIQAAVSYRLLNGNSYINAVSPNAGQAASAPIYNFEPAELWVNRADKYKVIEGTIAPVGGYEYSGSAGKKETFPIDQVTGESNVMHWKTFHPTDDFYGLSAIEAAAIGIDIYNLSLDWNNAFFANGAKPSGALIWKGESQMGDSTFNNLKKQVDEVYSGVNSNGKPLLLEGNMEWQQFSLSPKDMDFIQAKDTTAKDIARTFGVPPVLLNIGSDSTFNNQAEARLALWEDTVIPTMGSLTAELNTWLMPRYGDDAVLVMDLSEVSALEPKREQAWTRAQTADFLTTNEKRKLVGYEEVEGGDEVLINASQIPITFDQTATNDDSNAGADGKAVSYSAQGKSFTDSEFKWQGSGLELKLVNGSRRAEKREQAIQERLMKTLERPFAPKVFKILEKYVNRASRELSKNPDADITVILRGMNSELEKIYKPQYKHTIDIFSKRTLDGIKCIADMREIKQDAEDVFLQEAEKWIAENSADRVILVSDTTKDLIKSGVQQGIAEGATGTEMAKIIRGVAGGSISRNRSLVISRTETHMASQFASVETAKASGLKLKKVWISAEDERSREDHIETDSSSHSKPLDMDALFQVGTDSMLAPGMGSLPEQNVNCRCVVGYVSK